MSGRHAQYFKKKKKHKDVETKLHKVGCEKKLSFNSPKTRLRSYEQRERSSKVSSIELAQAGFRYVEETKHLLCDFCELELAEEGGNYFDPLAVHRVHSEGVCSYLKNLSAVPSQQVVEQSSVASDNVVKVSTVPFNTESETSLLTMTNDGAVSVEPREVVRSRSEDINEIYLACHKLTVKGCQDKLPKFKISVNDVRSETFRRTTFAKHRRNANTDGLASQGLFVKSLAAGDRLCCAFCEFNCPIPDENLLRFDHAIALHQKGSPQCSFVMGISNRRDYHNIPDIHTEHCWDSTGKHEISGFAGLGINYQLAKHPELAPADRRQQTFLTYPHQTSHRANFSQLCSAGYFYEGDADSVTCFWCGCTSAEWKTVEDPWIRHARTAASCQFILLQKGEGFVQAILTEHGVYRTPDKENRINTITMRMLRPRWETTVVQRALEIGLDKVEVKTVVINRIKKGEMDFRYLSEIVRAVSDLKVPQSKLSAAAALTLPTLVQEPSSLSESEEEEDEEETMVVDQVASEEQITENRNYPTETNLPEASCQTEESPELSAQAIKSQLTCKICLSDLVGIAFLPCGHLVCCVQCSAAMVLCPMCRQEIKATIKANL